MNTFFISKYKAKLPKTIRVIRSFKCTEISLIYGFIRKLSITGKVKKLSKSRYGAWQFKLDFIIK